MVKNKSDSDIDDEQTTKKLLKRVGALRGRQLSKVYLSIQLIVAYQKIVEDGLKPFIDVTTRMKWVKPLVYDHPLTLEKSAQNRYCEKLKSLFDLKEHEIFSITTEEIVTFLIINEENGIY
jgi:hypothetical protein